MEWKEKIKMKKENNLLKIEEKGEDIRVQVHGSGKDVLNLYHALTKSIKKSMVEGAENFEGIDDNKKEECVNELILDVCKHALEIKTSVEEKLDELLKNLEELSKEIGDENDV